MFVRYKGFKKMLGIMGVSGRSYVFTPMSVIDVDDTDGVILARNTGSFEVVIPGAVPVVVSGAVPEATLNRLLGATPEVTQVAAPAPVTPIATPMVTPVIARNNKKRR